MDAYYRIFQGISDMRIFVHISYSDMLYLFVAFNPLENSHFVSCRPVAYPLNGWILQVRFF